MRSSTQFSLTLAAIGALFAVFHLITTGVIPEVARMTGGLAVVMLSVAAIHLLSRLGRRLARVSI